MLALKTCSPSRSVPLFDRDMTFTRLDFGLNMTSEHTGDVHRFSNRVPVTLMDQF